MDDTKVFIRVVAFEREFRFPLDTVLLPIQHLTQIKINSCLIIYETCLQILNSQYWYFRL